MEGGSGRVCSDNRENTMRKKAKKHVPALTAALALVLTVTLVSGCGRIGTASKPAAAAVNGEAAEGNGAAEASAGETAAVRQNGERFETVIILEGMEETVRYEHVRNEAIGIEMDYDYESFARSSDSGRERFVSIYDRPESPENYLEVTYSPMDAESAAASVSETLSRDYTVIREPYMLDPERSCIRLDASETAAGGVMPEQLQAVYIIPAADGCRIAAAHYSSEGAEGFARRLSYLVKTLVVIERKGEGTLSDEQALSAIRNYCMVQNPELQSYVNSGEYPAYWDISASDEREIVVLYRSYTGAQVRYYIDRGTGNTCSTEFVPGITSEEVRTEESFNVRDYFSVQQAASGRTSTLEGLWQTASMAYEADGTVTAEYYVWFTDSEIIYGRWKGGEYVFDHSDPILHVEKTAAGGFRVQARASNGVEYTYQTSESDPDIMEYYETWREEDFPELYRGGASLSRNG